MQDAQQIVHKDEAFEDAPDKLFGVCLAIGEDLGFNPFYLRVALIALMVFSQVAAVAAYVALAVAVLLSRSIFPKPETTTDDVHDQVEAEVMAREELPLAA